MTTLKRCTRCDKIEEPSDVGAALVHFICDYCRLDSLEVGHQQTGVDELNERNVVDADTEREDNLVD